MSQNGVEHQSELGRAYKLSKYGFMGLVYIVAALFFIPFTPAKAQAADDYPSKWRDIRMDSALDDWGMYNRQCTSFVAWKLASRNGFNMPFHANASKWATIAREKGYMVDSTPAVGSVAYSANHVAWVEAVSGSYITVEDYNNVDSNGNGIYGDDGTYSRRTVPISKFWGYIHFKDLGAAESSGGGVAGLKFLDTNYLGPNQILRSGEYILSTNARYVLAMQSDGNLVLYGDGYRPIWHSGTYNTGANFAVMQGDGNLVLYRSNWTPVWASGTAGKGSSTFVAQDDGNAVIYTSDRSAAWSTQTGNRPTYQFIGRDRFANGEVLIANQYLRSSDKRYVVLLQGDGNLTVYSPGYRVLWSSGTGGKGVSYAVMQSDGNLVLYRSNWTPVWASGTDGYGLSFAVIQNDGNFVSYKYSGQPTWSTETNGRL